MRPEYVSSVLAYDETVVGGISSCFGVILIGLDHKIKIPCSFTVIFYFYWYLGFKLREQHSVLISTEINFAYVSKPGTI